MVISPEKYGNVARHYVRLGDDRAIPPAGQDEMIANMDASGIGGTTIVHQMAGSHSPFFAQPEALSKVLASIAG